MSGTIISDKVKSEESATAQKSVLFPQQLKYEANSLADVPNSITQDVDQQAMHVDMNASIDDMIEELLNYTPPMGQNIHVPHPPPQEQPQPSQNLTGQTQPLHQSISNPSVDTKADQSKIKAIYNELPFGRTKEISAVHSLDPQPFLQINESHLPFNMNISGLPSITRAENQMILQLELKRNLTIPMTKNCHPIYVHLPTNSMAKEKLYLNENNEYLQGLPEYFTDKVLFMDAYLICVPTNTLADVCEKCVVREKKRYSRRKSGLCDNILWCNNPNRNAILFSNRQLFPITNDLDKITIELKTRLTCYCKHHENTEAFKLLFVLRDHKNNIVSKRLSESVIIMGRKSEPTINKPKLNTMNILTPNINTPNNSVSSTDSPIQPQILQVNHAGYHFPSPSSSAQSGDNTNNSTVEDIISRENSQSRLNIPSTSTSQTQISLDKHLVSEDYYNLIFTQNKDNTNLPSNFSSPQDSNTPTSSNSGYGNTATPIFTDSNSNINGFDMRKRSRYNYESTPPSSSVESLHKDHVNTGFHQNYNLNMQELPMSIQNNPIFKNQMKPDVVTASYSSLPTLIPSIHKVIPGQGSISGGIEITLLGSNFKPGQIVEFGENMALSSQVWNSTTMVTFLPPAAKPGQVIVTVRDPSPNSRHSNRIANNNNNGNESVSRSSSISDDILSNKSGPVFTYIDDSDKQIIELALQIVGLKMNGKLDDPRNIARQIVDSTNQNSANNNNQQSYSNHQSSGNNYMLNDNQTDTERLLIDIINGTKEFNFTLRDEMGRTMLHYSCLKGYKYLTKLLVDESSHGLCQREDNFGFLPIHFAAINGSVDIINLVSDIHSASTSMTQNGYTSNDLYIINHSDEPNFSGSESESEWSDYSEQESEEHIESISIIHPKTGHEAMNGEQSDSLWNRMINRLNDDILPKYEDIFPKEYFDYSMNNSKMSELIDNHDQQSAGRLKISGSQTDEEEEEDEEDDIVEEYLKKIKSYQKEIKFKNDKMLLYFWLPLLVLLLSAMTLYSLGNNDDWIHYINDAVSKFTRSLLTTLFVGRETMSRTIKDRLSNFQPNKILKEIPKSIEHRLHA